MTVGFWKAAGRVHRSRAIVVSPASPDHGCDHPLAEILDTINVLQSDSEAQPAELYTRMVEK